MRKPTQRAHVKPRPIHEGLTPRALAETTAGLRIRDRTDPVVAATKLALRTLGRRVVDLSDHSAAIDAMVAELVTSVAPSLLTVYGVGVDTAAILLVAAGDNPERIRSEAAWAHLCGVAPVPASSGKVTRHRLDRGGNRQANHALWRIVFTRAGSDPRTRDYIERRMKEGLTRREVFRVLKRYVAREVYRHLPRP